MLISELLFIGSPATKVTTNGRKYMFTSFLIDEMMLKAIALKIQLVGLFEGFNRGHSLTMSEYSISISSTSSRSRRPNLSSSAS